MVLLVTAAVAFGCASARPKLIEARDRFPLDPREELPGPFPNGIDQGWNLLARGDAAGASREFGAARASDRLAAEIGWIEAETLLGHFEPALEACEAAIGNGEPTLPLLVACGETNGRGGRPAEGYRLYVRALARTANRPGLAARSEELRLSARDSLSAAARISSEEHQSAEARERIAEAILVAPESVALRVLAAEIELTAGDKPKAFQRYREAHELAPGNAVWQEKVGDLALELNEHALAVAMFDALARADPKFRPRAEEARLSFRVANWPAPERDAARAPRLSRAAAATLVWWMFPEVREARVSSSVIASDAVSRRDTRAFTRALALGLLEADSQAHRANPDGTLTLAAGSRLLIRLMSIVAPEGAPCLGKGASRTAPARTTTDAVKTAEGCGLWKVEEGSVPSGTDFTRALDRIRAVAGTGGSGAREPDEARGPARP